MRPFGLDWLASVGQIRCPRSRYGEWITYIISKYIYLDLNLGPHGLPFVNRRVPAKKNQISLLSVAACHLFTQIPRHPGALGAEDRVDLIRIIQSLIFLHEKHVPAVLLLDCGLYCILDPSNARCQLGCRSNMGNLYLYP